MAVGEHPAQELEREQGAEQQVDDAYPGRVGDEGGGEEVGERDQVEGEEAMTTNTARSSAARITSSLRATAGDSLLRRPSTL